MWPHYLSHLYTFKTIFSSLDAMEMSDQYPLLNQMHEDMSMYMNMYILCYQGQNQGAYNVHLLITLYFPIVPLTI